LIREHFRALDNFTLKDPFSAQITASEVMAPPGLVKESLQELNVMYGELMLKLE